MIACFLAMWVSLEWILAMCTAWQMIPSASQLATRARLSGASSTHFSRKAQGAKASEHKHPVQSERINLTQSNFTSLNKHVKNWEKVLFSSGRKPGLYLGKEYEIINNMSVDKWTNKLLIVIRRTSQSLFLPVCSDTRSFVSVIFLGLHSRLHCVIKIRA